MKIRLSLHDLYCRRVVVMATAAVTLGLGARLLAAETDAGGLPGSALADAAMLTPPAHPVAMMGPGVESAGGLGVPAIVNGAFVNLESAQVKPLALSDDGSRLFVTNTPNNTLVVLDAAAPTLSVLREIPTGLDPVAVAVQPGSASGIVWVANVASDNVSVINVTVGTVEAVIEVGDEPVNIVFDNEGRFAFVILQEGKLVAIDTATRTIADVVDLPCNTPRAAVYHDGKVIVAALHSGNNTTVVGKPVRFQLVEIDDVSLPLLWIPQHLSAIAPLFADPLISPWPDPPTSIPEGSPLVERIVPDAGVATSNGWRAIVTAMSDENGDPDPAMVDLFVQDVFEEFDVTLTNATELFDHVLHDAEDTIDNDIMVVDVSDPAGEDGMTVVAIISNVGTTLTGMGINPVSGDLFVSNMEPRNLIRHEPNLNGHIVDHQIVVVRDLDNPVVVRTDLHRGIADFNDVSGPNPIAQAASLANPVDIVFSDDGSKAYVAALGSSRVGMLDGGDATVLNRVDCGRGPRGLVLDGPAGRLYVMNRTDHSISVIDVSGGQLEVLETFALFNPESSTIREGRDFLYSTKFSFNFASSCATCHIDGHMDHVAWDLGDPDGALQPAPPNLPNLNNHPVKGPMVTQSFRGLHRRAPFHWRGDKERFQDFNGAFAGLLGGEPLSDEDMDAFTAFVETIQYPPNPFRHRDNAFKNADAGAGIALYLQACDTCHMVEHDGAMKVDGVEADAGLDLSALFLQIEMTTQLRGIHKKFDSDLYNGFGLVHDGRETREDNGHPLRTFLKTFFPGIGNNDQTSAELIAFVEAFPTNVAPVVGWQVAARAPINQQTLDDIGLMIARHDTQPSECDVVVKGNIADQLRGFYLSQVSPQIMFQSDTDELIGLNALLALVDAGNPLVFTATPPGTGRRIGINQDLDCLSDGLDPEPQVRYIGDSDLDDDVDFGDFAAMQRCFGGEGVVAEESCRCAFDGDDDGDIDRDDFAIYLDALTGP